MMPPIRIRTQRTVLRPPHYKKNTPQWDWVAGSADVSNIYYNLASAYEWAAIKDGKQVAMSANAWDALQECF